MPSGIAQTAKTVVKQSCPNLALGLNRTSSSAFHVKDFVGTLCQWTNFEVDVENTCSSFNWTPLRAILSHRPKGTPGVAYLSNEHVVCGDETGVQGRFQNNVGQVISAALRAAGQSVAFGDYKASPPSLGLGQKVPDVVCFSTIPASLLVVGEVKTPWVPSHSLVLQSATDKGLRRILGEQTHYKRYTHQS